MNTVPVSTLLRHVRRIAAKHADNLVSDRELLERFLERREEDAFATLLGRHGPMVLAVCRSIAHDGHAAEDAFQARFLPLAPDVGRIRRGERAGSLLEGVDPHGGWKAVTR